MDANEYYLGLGDPWLNRLLAPEQGQGSGGLRIGLVDSNTGLPNLEESPIVVVQGSAGAGKTTLALQIANAVVGCQVAPEWTVVLVSLEQPERSLWRTAQNSGFDARRIVMLSEEADVLGDPGASLETRSVYISRLSPLPIRPADGEAVFQTRLTELQHIVERVRSTCKYVLVIIDSLNALASEPLTRNQVNQLFSLFRHNRIPLVATQERISDDPPEATQSHFAVFLADVVIDLGRQRRDGDVTGYLEVTKSRVCRQASGRHLVRTRTKAGAEAAGDRERTGIVVYPSVDFILSDAARGPDKAVFALAPELTELFRDAVVEGPSCFAIQGPPGSHKLALGLNLAVSRVNDRAIALVITFGGQGDINFGGVAWLESQLPLRELCSATADEFGDPSRSQLLSRTLGTPGQGQASTITTLTFSTRPWNPEECLLRISQILEAARKDPYRSVLISDTGELCSGFPLLANDKMFFSAMLDLFQKKGMMTIGIGVESKDPTLMAMNLALMSKATHRVVLRHYPGADELIAGKVACQLRAAGPVADQTTQVLEEQLVSVITDNVTGKHYRRQPKWLSVEEVEGSPKKTLRCDPYDRPPLPSQAI